MKKLPGWLKQDIPDMRLIRDRLSSFKDLGLNTVCESAHCPNIFDCFKRDTTTFMILGDICTRDCKFCAVQEGRQKELDLNEPRNVAQAAKDLGLDYVVITSVTRDDLKDGGAGHFADTVIEVKGAIPASKVEILIPDFKDNIKSLKKVSTSGADVISHNMETVSRLYRAIRPQADYKRSLKVLKEIKKINNSIITKSGIMVGLGETYNEVIGLFRDLRNVDCDIVTIGQYLAPSKGHAEVKRFVSPDEFKEMESRAYSLGFKSVLSAPLVRSSFHSEELLEKCTI